MGYFETHGSTLNPLKCSAPLSPNLLLFDGKYSVFPSIGVNWSDTSVCVNPHNPEVFTKSCPSISPLTNILQGAMTLRTICEASEFDHLEIYRESNGKCLCRTWKVILLFE